MLVFMYLLALIVIDGVQYTIRVSNGEHEDCNTECKEINMALCKELHNSSVSYFGCTLTRCEDKFGVTRSEIHLDYCEVEE